MSDNNLIVNAPGQLAALKPDFLKEEKVLGNEQLSLHIIPPRLIIVQPLSKEPLSKYPKGTPLIMPSEQQVGEYSDGGLTVPLLIIPIFYFVEYTLDNPRSIRMTHGAVRDRSFDHTSELAVRAANPKLREIQCPEAPKEVCRYTTRLNYIIRIQGVADPVLVTFKVGEMRVGMAFNSLLQARRAPIFGCVFEADVGFRSNGKGEWYGLDVSNPQTANPWVDDAEAYATLKAEHMQYAKAFESKLIVPDLNDIDADLTPANSEF